jgi:asparagine synthase (glutamine-hydrolysing)
MCGFLTWFQVKPEAWAGGQRQLQAMALKSITHRGPDDEGEFVSQGAWMGFRRLSILDLSPAGHQPMLFRGGNNVLTFNGEIYNYRELAKLIPNMENDSTGDTSVLGELLAKEGMGPTLAMLRGMFAFAWWDEKERTVYAARDGFGIKPLYYHLKPNGDLLLGSELRALHQLAQLHGDLSPVGINQYFRWGAVQAPNTILAEIYCLPPGHTLVWKDGGIKIEPWFVQEWPLSVPQVRQEKELVSETRETILNSVKAHLVADVPVGVFLSAGLDSSILAASMRHLGQEHVSAFSIGYEENAGVPDESDVAEKTAEHLGCSFHRLRLRSDDLEELLDQYLAQLDQPTGDGLNTWLVSSMAAQHVKVALSGTGADEWFGGYRYLRLGQLAAAANFSGSTLERQIQKGLVLMNDHLPMKIRGHKAWKAAFYLLGGAGLSPTDWQAHARSIYPSAALAELLIETETELKEMTLATPERLAMELRLQRYGKREWLTQMLLADSQTYLANTLLRDADAVSMAHSLELRVPFVDKDVFELASRIPSQLKLKASTGKYILREAFKDILPEWIYGDKIKKTFTLPLMKWLRQPAIRAKVQDTLASECFRQRRWVNYSPAQRMIKRFFDSKEVSTLAWQECQMVWLMFVLESWSLNLTAGKLKL